MGLGSEYGVFLTLKLDCSGSTIPFIDSVIDYVFDKGFGHLDGMSQVSGPVGSKGPIL